MVKIVYLFHAGSLITAGNKDLIVHVWKETDKHVNRNLHCFSLSIYLCFKLITNFTVPYASVERLVWHPTLSCLHRDDKVKNLISAFSRKSVKLLPHMDFEPF